MSARRIARNWPLVSGLCLIGVMLSLALGAPWMDMPDPMAQTRFVRDETGYHWKPFEPGEVRGFPLGTDFDGRDVRSRLIWGLRPTLLLALSVALIRIALAASVVLFGALGIIIYQDRTEAKAFIRQEKALQGIRDVKFGPMFGKGTQGASFGFRF